MEIRWLEDFLTLARCRSFSRAAELRNVSQSSFSRRIQALEAWLSVPLIDRSTYPLTLTDEGQQFLETAEETCTRLQASRDSLRGRLDPGPSGLSVAALHTLSLTFFPGWLRRIEAQCGPLRSRLLATDFHGCVEAFSQGGYDLMACFHHPAMPVLLDPGKFQHLTLGRDHLVFCAAPDLDPGRGILGYPAGSFLGRVIAAAQPGPENLPRHINENAFAEGLKFMAIAGHGAAWLPRSLVRDEIAAGLLHTSGREIALDIRLYRPTMRGRPLIEAVWAAAERQALPPSDIMPPG